MNRHWMGGSRKRVAERRVGKVERQQRAFFEARRRAQPPIVNAPSPLSNDAHYTSSSLLSRTLPLRECSFDLVMLNGPAQPLIHAKKHRRDEDDDTLVTEHDRLIDQIRLKKPAISAEKQCSTSDIKQLGNDWSRLAEASRKQTPEVLSRTEESMSAGATLPARTQDSDEAFKIPLPRTKPNYFFSATAPPQHKGVHSC